MKKISKIIALVLITFFASWLVLRQAVVWHAGSKAQTIIEEALQSKPSLSSDEKIIALTGTVFKRFKEQEPSQVLLLRLRPYLTNQRLPSFVRLPNGVLETELERGYCDNAARMLGFILKHEGIDSEQWNMIQPHAAHSALVVYMPDSRKILADPFYGFVTADKKRKLLTPEQAQELMKRGSPLEDAFLAYNGKSRPGFYKNFTVTTMAAQGEPMTITAIIPETGINGLTLGQLDGQSQDVRGEANQRNMTTYWDYMGHKYSRQYVRVLEAQQSVKVTMTLTQSVEHGIMIASPTPVVEDKVLTWELQAGERITFIDGLAQISWIRLNSYIPIDQISFTPLN